MKIDENETRAVAASQARVDLYTGIHKALRAFMADTLLAVGRMDTRDELDFVQVTQRVLELLDICRSHLAHENDFVHSALEARAPGSAKRVAEEHEEHEREIGRLALLVAELGAQPRESRDAMAARLYRELAGFIAGNFQHMAIEESEHNAALWAHYSAQELIAIHEALVASIPPQEMMATLRWMVPFMNPGERVELLQGIRRNAPPPVFTAVIATVRPHLTAREWDKLAGALQIA
jgi:hypothetical protein